MRTRRLALAVALIITLSTLIGWRAGAVHTFVAPVAAALPGAVGAASSMSVWPGWPGMRIVAARSAVGDVRANVPVPRFGSSVHLRDPLRYAASDPQYARKQLPDDEPAVAIAPDGTVWVAALHLHHGTALWRGRFAVQTPRFVGQPDHGLGGDDIALAVARPPVGSATSANLYLASMVAGSGAIAATTCPGGVVAGNFAACSFYPALGIGPHDRPWLASAGRATLYLSYTEQTALLTGGVTVRRSVDGGRTWTPAGSPTADVATGTRGWAGNLDVDPRSGTLYQILETTAPGREDGPFNRMVVARSRDGGATWRDVTVYQGAPDEDDANMWPALAVDAAGAVYAAWSDGHHILISSSSDGGATWSAAARVDAPAAGLRASVLPALAAGAPGHVVLAWYGSTSPNNLSTTAAWRVVFAASRDGGRGFAQTFATGVIHRGPVCTKGAACPYTQRQLLDLLGVALDPRSGRAAIAYARSIEFGDYLACRAAANCPQVYYVEQVAVGH